MKKKKIAALILGISLALVITFVFPNLSYGAGNYNAYSPNKTGVTTVNAVMRSGASTSNSKITTVSKGQTVTIYGYEEANGLDWYKVKYGSNTGYIREDLIKVTGTVSSSSSSSSSNSSYVEYSTAKTGTTNEAVNMRTGSSTTTSKILTIPKGKSVTIYGYDDVPGTDWYKVKYGSSTGYVRSDYVDITGVVEKASSIKGSGITTPTTLTKGKGFAVKGTLTSVYNIVEVKVGIMSVSSNTFYSSYTATAKPNSTTYDISKLDANVPFRNASVGTYYYTVWAKDAKGNEFTVSKTKFSVVSATSTLKIENASTPGDRYYGASFPVKGVISSNNTLNKVEVKVYTDSGKVVSNCNETVNPNSTSYNINKLDSAIKVSKLEVGDYTYKVTASDGVATKTLVEEDFEVKSLVTTINGKTLKYNTVNFNKIGKQPYSGPCGLYAMAYGRLVIDGSFTINSKYDTVCDQLLAQYGYGTSTAYWSLAGASSVWTSNAKTAYQNVLKEIDAGRPCIIPVTTSRGTNHFVTVIGYTNGTTASNVDLSRLVILDPGYGTQSYGNIYGYKDKDDSQARYIKFNW